MLLQVFPLSANCKRAKALLPKVALHIGRIDAVGFGRIQRALDSGWIGSIVGRLALLRLPVLHHHGNAGRAAAVFFLLHERNVEPDGGTVHRPQRGAEPEQHDRDPEAAAQHF